MSAPAQALASARTIDVDVAPTESPAILGEAGPLYMRVMVRNLGPAVLVLSTDAAAVQEVLATSESYTLPVNGVDVFPLSPGQRLYAVGLGAGGRCSVFRSPATPVASWGES